MLDNSFDHDVHIRRCCLRSMEPNPFVQIIERIISMLSLDGCGCGAKLEQRCQSGIQVRIPYSVYRLLCRVLPGTVVGLFHDESMQKNVHETVHGFILPE